VQITNPGGYSTRTSQRTLYGVVQAMTVTQVKLVRNNTDTSTAPCFRRKIHRLVIACRKD
jgi:hypothetical protein